MKFTVFLTLLPVVLAVPSSKRYAPSCILEEPACDNMSVKCANEINKFFEGTPRDKVPAGFAATHYASCVATMICMGGPEVFRKKSCIGLQFPFPSNVTFGEVKPEIITQITACHTANCTITPQNVLDLVHSQLTKDFPEPEHVLTAWWGPLVKRVAPSVSDPAHTTLSVKDFNTWASFTE